MYASTQGYSPVLYIRVHTFVQYDWMKNWGSSTDSSTVRGEDEAIAQRNSMSRVVNASETKLHEFRTYTVGGRKLGPRKITSNYP